MVAAISFAPFVTPRVYAAPPCTTRGDNLTRNGSMSDDGYATPHGIVANGWNPFLLSGEYPTFELAHSENANGDVPGASQYMFGDEVLFDAGMYQVVSGVQPGAAYEFSIGLGFMLRDLPRGRVNQKIPDVIFRRAGVDPYGGTDPASPNVMWGPPVGTESYSRSLNHPDLRVVFHAQAPQVTVFVRAYNVDYGTRDKVFFDVLCLLPRADIAPQSIEPTATVTPLATEIPPTVAATPQPRATRTPTRAPSPTNAPPTQPARFATHTRVARNQPTASAVRTRVAIPRANDAIADAAQEAGTFVWVGAGVVSFAILLAGAAAFLLLRKR